MITNEAIALQLEELADLLAAQRANSFRVSAYRNAARAVRQSSTPVAEVVERGGEGLLRDQIEVGESLARSIAQIARTGYLGMLGRLRGEAAPEALLRLVPAIGPKLAQRIHEDLGVESVEELRRAVASGRVAQLTFIGPKRLRALEEFFHAHAAHRVAGSAEGALNPSVAELLDVDAEYRQKAESRTLPLIAPRRQNPKREAWLPILHTEREGRHYTALFSNTTRAHELGKTRDWVVIFLDDDGGGQWTVISSTRGALAGLRIVRGREKECEKFYLNRPKPRRAGTSRRVGERI